MVKLKWLVLLTLAFLTACPRDAQIASRNLSVASEMFQIARRVIFYNGISGEYILTIEGFCSITKDTRDNQLEVVCKTGTGYKKHFLGVSDNVTYFAEQLSSANVSADHYKVIFKPSVIVPDIEVH